MNDQPQPTTRVPVTPVMDANMPTGLDSVQLRSALEQVRQAGVPGVYAAVRAGEQTWQGAAGVADIETGQPVSPDMHHRVGSVTKTFTAAAVLQQVERGSIRLDRPIADYLPRLVPGDRGNEITVRMLLNHTSGLAEYLPHAFPSLRAFPTLANLSPESLDHNRNRRFDPIELIEMGVRAPATGSPGATPGVYSNTNYLLLGELLDTVTGESAETYITHHVIEPAGLANTRFPRDSVIDGPHSRSYEAAYGLLDPPRDYSVYDMSWVRTAAALLSTMEDLNSFYRSLFDGEIVHPDSLAQMQRTVPVIAQDGARITYGLGLHRVEMPGCEPCWGHDGTVWGAFTLSLIAPDSQRQLSVATNLVRWNALDSTGKPRQHPIDDALASLRMRAMCGKRADG